MVNGVNGVGTNGLSAAELKEFVQELIDETLATKESEAAANSEVTAETADEESGLVVEGTTEQAEEVQTDKVENPLTGILTSITSMFETLMNALLEVVGAKKDDAAATDDEAAAGTTDTGNEKYVMTEDEKAYLTLHPDYVKDLIAEEKYQEKYGNKKGLFANALKSSRLERLARTVTDAEVQAYLQLHPNVIKDAIASGK